MSTRIVILGGGFAGLYTARHLRALTRKRADPVRITLISRDNFFTMTPLLFEAGSGVLEPRHAVNPIRPMFHHGSTVRFVEAEITRVDFDRRIVHAQLVEEDPFEVEYDHLVVALGGVTNTSIVPGSQHAMTFKTLADAIYLRNHAIERFEQADVSKDAAKKRALLTFVIIGAGLVGSELQGELSDFLHHVRENYPSIRPEELRFELIEAGPRIMAEMDEDLAAYALDLYRSRGINVRLNTPVSSITPGKVSLPHGEVIEAQTIIVVTGVSPSPLVGPMELPKTRKGRIDVDASMRVKGRENVWSLGDCASIPDPNGKPYPQLAQHAIREARVLAKNIVAQLDGKPLKPFIYRSMGTLAALGKYKGVGRVMSLKLRGFPAWFVWRSYYLMQMPRWSRRLRIMLDWTVALLFSYDVVELDLVRDRPIDRGVSKNENPDEKKPSST